MLVRQLVCPSRSSLRRMMLWRRPTMTAVGGGLASIAIAVLAACGGGSGEDSPWLFCTTSPCQPLALLQLPTPPALSDDASLAAVCDADGSVEGILLWHTDWDPRSEEGLCVTPGEAEALGADLG